MAEMDHTQQTSAGDIQIRFLLADGRVIAQKTYRQGEPVQVPRMKQELVAANTKYVFKGWSAKVQASAARSADYVAVYEKMPVITTTGTQVLEKETVEKEEKDKKFDWKLPVAVIAAVTVIALLAALLIGFKDEIGDFLSGFTGSSSRDDREDEDDRDDRKHHSRDEKEECSHRWVDATCEEPEICKDCGQTRGGEKGHNWMAATCADPQICTACGETQGAANGHSWIAATRSAPKICSVCGATDGEPLPAPNVNVGNQVQWVSDEYYEIEDLLYADELYREEVSREVYYYYDHYGDIRMVVTAKGNDGIGQYSDQYRRYYYFSDGELIFAYFEGQDCHRMYFYQGELMRWRYQGVGQSRSDAVNEDFTYSDEFLKWESLALQEVKSFGVI